MRIRHSIPLLLLALLLAGLPASADTTISGSITFSTGLNVSGNRVSIGAPANAILLGYDSSLGGFQNVVLGSNLTYTAGVLNASGPGGGVSLNNSALIETKTNGGLGTTANKLVVYVPSSATVQTASVSDTSVIGICVPGGVTGAVCGPNETAAIAVAGSVACVFDNAPTAGDYVVASTTVGGNCHDAGIALPAQVQIIGFSQITNASPGTYAIDLSDMGVAAAITKKAQPGGVPGQIQYNNGGAFGGLGPLTNGQMLIGSTGNAAVPATLTAGANVTITNGPGTITIAASGAGNLTVTSQTGPTYTLTTADCGSLIRFTAATAVTLPNSLSVGCDIKLSQAGSGAVTLTDAPGATNQSAHGYTKTFGPGAVLELIVDTNAGGLAAHYLITGDGA